MLDLVNPVGAGRRPCCPSVVRAEQMYEPRWTTLHFESSEALIFTIDACHSRIVGGDDISV
jgi:hypothetical protein